MKRYRPVWMGCALAGLAVVAVRLYAIGFFEGDVWKREEPLANPIAVTEVRGGALTLVDGRVLRPAGIARRDEVPPAEFDDALRIVTAQGVEVQRDFGDGRAFLLAEPKFYNWCGTRNYAGKGPWYRWAGSYLRCPVSELLIQSAYAMPTLDRPGLDARDRWRLEGAGHLDGSSDPRRISRQSSAFRYDGSERCFSDYDVWLELVWQPPPSP